MEGKSDAVPTIGRADSHDPITVAVEPGGKVDQAEAVQKASLAAYIVCMILKSQVHLLTRRDQRIFSYSTPLDIVLLCAAGAAAIGAGIVGAQASLRDNYLIPNLDPTSNERSLRYITGFRSAK